MPGRGQRRAATVLAASLVAFQRRAKYRLERRGNHQYGECARDQRTSVADRFIDIFSWLATHEDSIEKFLKLSKDFLKCSTAVLE
ncbi:MAG: hypothetical protein ACREOO_12780 [bacterium]